MTLSQYLENLGWVHWQATQRVLKYFKGTADYALTFGTEGGVGMLEGKPAGYADADFAAQEHQHSVLGYVFLIHEGAIFWSLKMQATITLSSTEAEYIVGTHMVKEVKWLGMLLTNIETEPPRPFPLFADNLSAITLSKDNTFRLRTKHIDIQYHYVWEAVENEELQLNYNANENIADTLTKPLTQLKVEVSAHMKGLIWLPSILGGVCQCQPLGTAGQNKIKKSLLDMTLP